MPLRAQGTLPTRPKPVQFELAARFLRGRYASAVVRKKTEPSPGLLKIDHPPLTAASVKVFRAAHVPEGVKRAVRRSFVRPNLFEDLCQPLRHPHPPTHLSYIW